MTGEQHEETPFAASDMHAVQTRMLELLEHHLIDTAVVFGSGLGGVARSLMSDPIIVPFRELTGMPQVPFIDGHQGQLWLGKIGTHRLAMFLGRHHLYQGLRPVDVVYPVRLAAALGAREIVLTNAAGSLDIAYSPGELMLIDDHINLTGLSPLDALQPIHEGSAFVPMTDAYSPRLRTEALWAAKHAGVHVSEGVYVGLRGPHYETPAEVEFLRRTGGHAVGMSTVLETIAARALRMKVLGLSLITNRAGTLGTHEGVLQAADDSREALHAVLSTYLHREELHTISSL